MAEIEQKDVIANVRTNLEVIFKKLEKEMKPIYDMMKKDDDKSKTREKFLKDKVMLLRREADAVKDILGILNKQDVVLLRHVDWLRIMNEVRDRLVSLSGKDYAILEKTMPIFKSIAEKMGVAEHEAERFAKQLIYSTGPVKEGLPWYMRIGRTISSMAEGTHRLTAASTIYVSKTGEIIPRQRMSAALMQTMAEGIQNMVRSLTRGMAFWAAIAYAIYEIVNRSIKFNGELRGIQASAGLLNEHLRLGNTYLVQAVDVGARITRLTGRMMGEVMEWVKDIKDAGILLGSLVHRNLGYVFDTAAALRGVQEAFNISARQSAEIIHRLQLNFGMVRETALKVGSAEEFTVSEATKFYLGVVNTAARLGDVGIQASKVVSDMGELVRLGDQYDLSVRDISNMYLSLLALKRADVHNSMALRDVSEESLHNFAEMAVKASSMSLSWKVMVATLAGEHFRNIAELEERFANVGEAAGMLTKAAMAPFRMGVLMQWDPATKKAFGELLLKGGEQAKHAEGILRAVWSLYEPMIGQLGMSYEMFKAITISSFTGRELSEAQKKMLKDIEKQMEYAERPVKLGFDILTETQGIAGYLKVLVGYAFTVVRLLARLVGVRPEKTVEEVRKELDVVGDVLEKGFTALPSEEERFMDAAVKEVSTVFMNATQEQVLTLETSIERMEKMREKLGDVEAAFWSLDEDERKRWLEEQTQRMKRITEVARREYGIDIKMETIVDPQSLRIMIDKIIKELERKMAALQTRSTATTEMCVTE